MFQQDYRKEYHSIDINLFYKQALYKQLALNDKLLRNFQDFTLFHYATMKTTG